MTRSTLRLMILACMVGVVLFLIDSLGSLQKQYVAIPLGAPASEAARYLRDFDGPLCQAAFERTNSECWFRDSERSYRIVIDPNSGTVTAKLSWPRKPRSLLDRIFASH